MVTKVMTIVGTRPEIIKLSRVIAELEENVEHILVHTGQNYDYELNEIFFNDLRVKKPDHFLNCLRHNWSGIWTPYFTSSHYLERGYASSRGQCDDKHYIRIMGFYFTYGYIFLAMAS